MMHRLIFKGVVGSKNLRGYVLPEQNRTKIGRELGRLMQLSPKMDFCPTFAHLKSQAMLPHRLL